MAPLASHVADLPQDVAAGVGSGSSGVLSPISSTGPAHLRRAVYVKVSDLARPFNIDPEKLRTEIARLEAARDDAGAALVTEGRDDKAIATDGESAGKVEGAGTEAQLSRLQISGSSKENIGEGQYQQKSPQQKLVPPSGGFNLCLLVGKVEIVVDKLRVDRSRVRLAEVEVGDETGCVSLRARDGQIDVLKEISDQSGAVVLRNCTIELYQGRHLRLAVTKWGKLSPFPDQVPSTPPEPLTMNRDTNYSAVDLNLVVGEMGTPSSPDTADLSSSASSSQGPQQSRPSPHSTSKKEGFEDTGSSRPQSGGSRGHQSHRGQQQHYRKGGRERKHQQHYRQAHASGRGTPLMSYGTMPTTMVVPGMPAYPPMYTGGSTAELPQYGFPVPTPHRDDDGQRQYTDFEAVHHQKQQQLIAQHYELQQRHFEQMHLYHQQQERHRRMFEPHGQQHSHQMQQHQSPHMGRGSPAPPMGSRILPPPQGQASLSQLHPGKSMTAGDTEFHQSPTKHPGSTTFTGRAQKQHGREGNIRDIDQNDTSESAARQRGQGVSSPNVLGVPSDDTSIAHPLGAWQGHKLRVGSGIETPPPSPGRMNPQAASFAPSYAKSPAAMHPSHQQIQSPQYTYMPYNPMQTTGPVYGSPMTPHQHQLYSQGAPYIPAIHEVESEEHVSAGPARQDHTDTTVTGTTNVSAAEKSDVTPSETHEIHTVPKSGASREP